MTNILLISGKGILQYLNGWSALSKIGQNFSFNRLQIVCHSDHNLNLNQMKSWLGLFKGDWKSRFHADFSHKSRQKITWNSCLRLVYPITLDARLIIHAITQFFIQFPFSRSKICRITPSRFPLGGSPSIKGYVILV